MKLIEILADFIARDLEPDKNIMRLSKNSIIDCFGAIVLGSQTGPVRSIMQLVNSKGRSSIIGLGSGYSAREAAFINGVSGHILELDDTSSSNLGHPTVAVLPALLAVGQEYDCSGKDLIKSFIIATEVECKIGRICARDLHKRGWHASSVTGVIGAAAGCSYLLGLDYEEIKSSLGIAASLASGVRENFGTSTKPIHIGKTAENGVLAAYLAKEGIKSSPKALDGKEGYLYLYANKSYGEFGGDFAKTLGNDYDICWPGFTLKRYPSCSSSHRAIDAFIDMARDYKFQGENIREISCGLGQSAIRELVTPNPTTGDEAKFSIGFQIALFLYDIKNIPESYNDAIIRDKRIQDIIKKIKIYHEVEFDNLSADMGVGPAQVTVITKDGREYSRIREYPVGHLTDPMTEEELKNKYMDCTDDIIGPVSAKEIYQRLMDLENVDSISELLQLLD